MIAIAGISALTGGIADGAVVYRALQQPANLPAPIKEVLPSGNTNPGDQIPLEVVRGNETMQLQVTLGEVPQGE